MRDASGTCRAGCGERLADVLIDRDGQGIHAGCIEQPRPVLPELQAILARHQAGADRSRQQQIGPSEIGVDCDRQLGYRLFGRPNHKATPDVHGRIDPETLKWAPLVGTWCHSGIAEALAAENAAIGRQRYLIEQRVTVSAELGISGVTDCFDTDRYEVIDWKAIGKTRLQHYRRHGPGPQYQTQAHLYGKGWANEGMPVASVRVVFLPKWSHQLRDGWEWAEPYQPATADTALARLARLRTLGPPLGLSATGGQWGLLPGVVTEENCRYCPWRRPGGPADATGCPGDTAQVYEKAHASFAKDFI